MCGSILSRHSSASEITDHLREESEVFYSSCYSTVKRFTRKGSPEEYAVKIIDKSHLTPIRFKSLAEEEYLLGRLDHGNIVKFYGSFTKPTSHFLVFELLNRGDLYHHVIVKHITSHCEENVASYMRDIFNGLWYCHDKKIIHRNLKPPNLCVTEVGGVEVVKLIDFGSAVNTDGTSRCLHGLCSTPDYSAPELRLGVGYGASMDLFACGCILYNLLSGSHPYVPSTRDDYVSSSPKPTLEGISESAKDIVTKLLHRDPDQRITASGALEHSFCSLPRCGVPGNHLYLDVEKLREFTRRDMWGSQIFNCEACGKTTKSHHLRPRISSELTGNVIFNPVTHNRFRPHISSEFATHKHGALRCRY